MNRTRTVLFAASIAAAMVVGGVVTASALANSPLSTVYAAASPSPTGGTFKSNEDPTHEKGETAAQETAENNGTFHPGGPGGGPSNETAAHEASESATREASEKS
jgi:hypothetical protein